MIIKSLTSKHRVAKIATRANENSRPLSTLYSRTGERLIGNQKICTELKSSSPQSTVKRFNWRAETGSFRSFRDDKERVEGTRVPIVSRGGPPEISIDPPS